MAEIPQTSAGSPEQDLRELVISMARALADDPSAVRVESETVGGELVLRLIVSPDDLGKLIGKNGRTARSLRAIVGAAANKLRCRCAVDIQSE